jgi:hypothetical protein
MPEHFLRTLRLYGINLARLVPQRWFPKICGYRGLVYQRHRGGVVIFGGPRKLIGEEFAETGAANLAIPLIHSIFAGIFESSGKRTEELA